VTLIAEPPAAPVRDQHGELVPDVVLRAAANPGLNAIEAAMAQLPQVEIPITHRFTSGLYGRAMQMPAGVLATSKIHKTTHQFVISKGCATIWTENEGCITVDAPFHGITTPGTRRLIFAHTEVVWTTFHPTDETDPLIIEQEIIFPHHIPFANPQEVKDFIHLEEARK
jgi:hypothetical protein